jgi:hypothetical protein
MSYRSYLRLSARQQARCHFHCDHTHTHTHTHTRHAPSSEMSLRFGYLTRTLATVQLFGFTMKHQPQYTTTSPPPTATCCTSTNHDTRHTYDTTTPAVTTSTAVDITSTFIANASTNTNRFLLLNCVTLHALRAVLWWVFNAVVIVVDGTRSCGIPSVVRRS